MRKCPLCDSINRMAYSYKTYSTCMNCKHTYQPDPPPKRYLNPDEDFNGGENSVMGDHEKAVNKGLANWIFNRLKPNRIFDIGSAYPYFMNCFRDMGCDVKASDGIYYTNWECDLDVPMIAMDWEDENEHHADHGENDLITMVHVLEHFIDPVWCLKKAYDNLKAGGHLYIRCPNKDVKGIERDHTEGHALIHPSIFGSKSMVFAAEKAGFTLLWSEDMAGGGQSAWIFKKGKISISVSMIVKNEEENIVNCIRSLKDHVDEIVVLDTGSTDKTRELAGAEGAIVVNSSEFDENTEVKNFNFSAARNESLGYVSGDWVLWMDADDTLKVDEIKLSDKFDTYYTTIKYGNTSFNQARFFRNNWGVHFKGAIHEFAVIDTCRLGTLKDFDIYHKCGEKEGRTDRNLSILKVEYDENPDSKRTMFYLANAYREAGKHHEALKYYQDYINTGGNFNDEMFLALYYKGLSHYCLKDYDASLKALHDTIAFDDRWAESYSLAGECYYFKRQYKKAISYLTIASEMPMPITIMFVEVDRYGAIPKLWIDLCRERMREAETYTIEVRRPGALGDVLCTTPAVRELRKQSPNAHIRYVTHPSSASILKNNPDIDSIVDSSAGMHSDVRVEFAYPMSEGYPDVPMDRHLITHFAECAGVKLSDDRPVLDLSDEPSFSGFSKPIITFAVRTGWSRYKEWPLERWEELIKIFPEYDFVQLGAEGEAEIAGAIYMMGKVSLRGSFNILAKSELFIGLDSVFNHATRALGVPAVIMFGSTSPIGSGYEQNTNLWSAYECSPCYKEDNAISVHRKPPCPHEHKCMVDFMTVERVAEAVMGKLKTNKLRQKALPIAEIVS